MVAEYLPARFTFHDLLRAYAADLAERIDPEPERRAAVHRVLDHYLHTAMAASNRFSPFRSPLQLAGPQPGVLPADVTRRHQAMAWFDAEVPVLLALIAYADASDFDTHAWQLPWTLARSSTGGAGGRTTPPPSRPRWPRPPGWRTRSPWPTRTTCSATSSRRPARTRRPTRTSGGHSTCSASSATGPTRPWCSTAWPGMLEKQERYPEALAVALDALRMLKAVGHWWTQATLGEAGVGWLYAHLGQYHRALTHCQRALSLHRDSGHRGGTPTPWTASATSTCT